MRPTWGAILVAAAAVGLAPPAAGAQSGSPTRASATATGPAGGRGTIYTGTYAKNILVVDEATMRVRDTIAVSVGIPYIMQLSFDRTHFYVLDPGRENLEIIDIASKRSTGRFSLSSGNRTVRMWGVNLDPQERFAVLLIKTYTKQSDRYEIGKPTLVKYDLAKRAVTDTIRWPNGEERESAQIIFSPKGDLLYFFTSDDVLIYDTQTLKQVDRWEMSRTFFEEGMGRINAGFPTDVYEDPGFYTGLFRVTDPVNRRTLMGVARVDLANRSLDFYTLGPTGPVSFRLAPGRTRAYGLRSEVGNYEFWTFDLANRRVVSKVQFAGRPRMVLAVASDGRQLYIAGAGSTIEQYDAATFRLLGTTNLGADMTAFVLIPPRPTPPAR